MIKWKLLYPFGFGLSFTQFSFENVSVLDNDDSIAFGIKVTNIGNVSGKEVVQVYAGSPETSLTQPAKELCGFYKTKELKGYLKRYAQMVSSADKGAIINR